MVEFFNKCMEKPVLAAGYKPVLCDYALDTCKSLKQSDLSGTGITLSGGAAFGTSHPWDRFPYDTALLLRMCWGAIPADVRYMT